MKKIIVSPFKTVTLSHRIYFFSNRANYVFGCCSPSGRVTLLDNGLNVIKTLDCTETVKKKGERVLFFKLHSGKEVFYIGSEDECRIYDYDGKILASLQENIEALHFVEDRDWLWYVKRIDSDTIDVWLRINGKKVANVILKDEISDSITLFEALPESTKVCLTLAGGQDGMMTYFLTYYDGQIIPKVIDELDSCANLGFNANKTKFITMNPFGCNSITCHSYPSLDVVNKLYLEENDIIVGYTTLYIDDRYALVEIGQEENIYKVLDTITMSIVADFIVEGHEPKPVSYYYPTLKDENEITDLVQFHQVCQTLYASYKAKPEKKEVNSLLMLKYSDIQDQIKEVLYK